MNTKLRCLLLDDELPGLTYLKMLCEQVPELEVVKAFDNPETLLAELPDLDFDLCILDIEMPQMSGLQVATALDGKPVIFVTAYKEYAAEAFDLNAIDYMRKPVMKDRLQQAVQKAMQRVGKKSAAKAFVQLNTDRGKALLFFDQLCYVKNSEIDSRDKVAVLDDGTSLILKNISFEKLEKLLPPSDFCRINKKEVLAIRSVKHFSCDEITTTLSDKSGAPLRFVLSDVYRNSFVRRVKI